MCHSYASQTAFTVFSQLNAGGVYSKLGLVDPAFIRTRRLFGARRLFIECIFDLSQLFIFLSSVLKVFNKNVKNIKQCHQLCLVLVNHCVKSFCKKTSLTGTMRNVNFSPWNTEKMYRQLLDSKRTLQAMENKVVSRFLLHEF